MIEGICYGDCFHKRSGSRLSAGTSHIHIGDEIKFVDIPKLKPLAQYLAEYIEHEIETGGIDISCQGIEMIPMAYHTWEGLLEQALDAYESTENVTIKIERDI